MITWSDAYLSTPHPYTPFGPGSHHFARPAHRFQTRQWAAAPCVAIRPRTELTNKGLGYDVARLEWWDYPGFEAVGERSETWADSAMRSELSRLMHEVDTLACGS